MPTLTLSAVMYLQKEGDPVDDEKLEAPTETKTIAKSPRKRPAWTRNSEYPSFSRAIVVHVYCPTHGIYVILSVEIKERDVLRLEGHHKEVFIPPVFPA